MSEAQQQDQERYDIPLTVGISKRMEAALSRVARRKATKNAPLVRQWIAERLEAEGESIYDQEDKG